MVSTSFFGGPDRQIFGLAQTFRQGKYDIKSVFASFYENGRGREFIEKTQKEGFQAVLMKNDTPHLWRATRELSQILRDNKPDIVFLHGFKPRLLGWIATCRLNVPIVGVSHGWTGEDWKVRLYDKVDKWVHHRMDHVICVSKGQAEKVIRSGTPKNRVSVIHNAVQMERFMRNPVPEDRHTLEQMFQRTKPPRFLLGAVGRLSPEKGFDVLLNALATLDEDVGLIIFGEGVLRDSLEEQAKQRGIADRVVFAGFTSELDRYMPHFDLFVQSSHTEGLPCVLLEAMGAETAVVATNVGGTNEVVLEGETGLLVSSNDVTGLANAVRTLLAEDELRRNMGQRGRKRVQEHFTFEAQAVQYCELVDRLLGTR